MNPGIRWGPHDCPQDTISADLPLHVNPFVPGEGGSRKTIERTPALGTGVCPPRVTDVKGRTDRCLRQIR